MTVVQEATLEMFPQVLRLLAQFNVRNPQITTGDWKMIFTHPWRRPGDPIGYVLKEGDEIIGFLGTLCSRRMIRGEEHKFCNLTSWVTDPKHRPKSLLLLNPVLALSDYTITNQTPAKHIHGLFQKLGFQLLEDRRRVLYPVPDGKSFRSGYRTTSNPEIMKRVLNGNDAAILRDHLPLRCGHLLIYNDRDYAYLVYTRTKGRKIHFSHIHYISNLDVFLRNLDRVKIHLLFANRTLFTMVDKRFLGNAQIRHGKDAIWPRGTLFRSAALKAEDIDNLYSELILLNL